MKNNKVIASIDMIVSKTFSGFNMNALKYLLPTWMAPLTGVTLRVVFGAIAFWIIGLFIHNEPETSYKQKGLMFLLGAAGIYGYMSTYLVGLNYTTPVSSSIILALIPIWVFLLTLIFFSETWSVLKGIGLFIGLSGAVLSMLSKRDPTLASNPLLGDSITLISSFIYALYIIFSKQLLKRVGIFTLIKWTFTGASCVAVIVNVFSGFDAPVLSRPLHITPFLVLLFVLIFPTVLSYVLLPYGIKYLKPTVVAMYGYIVIIVATITALLLGQDKFNLTQLFSIILLCIGVYLVETAESAKSSKNKSKE